MSIYKNINFNKIKLKEFEMLPKDSVLNNYMENFGEEEVWIYDGVKSSNFL